MVKKLPFLVGTLVVLAAMVLLVLALFKNELFPEYSPAQRGLLVAEDSGCFNCHVRFDGRGSTNPLKGGTVDQIPNFFTERHGIDGIRQWIRNGVSDARRRRLANPREHEEQALKMPAFADRLSDAQIEDLVSFRRSSQGRGDRSTLRLLYLPRRARAGRRRQSSFAQRLHSGLLRR